MLSISVQNISEAIYRDQNYRISIFAVYRVSIANPTRSLEQRLPSNNIFFSRDTREPSVTLCPLAKLSNYRPNLRRRPFSAANKETNVSACSILLLLAESIIFGELRNQSGSPEKWEVLNKTRRMSPPANLSLFRL